MSTLAHDLRFAVRTFIARPTFTAVALLTLALGIGANTAIFSVVNAVLLRPLPYEDPDRLVVILSTRVRSGDQRGNIAPADFLDFARTATSLERAGANGWVGYTTVTGADEPERVGNVRVTWNFLRTLGVDPMLGRHFREDEDLPGGDRTAIISHGLWQRRFGSDRDIIGRTINLDSNPTTIIGVMPPTFRHIEHYPDREADIITLYQFEPVDGNRGGHFIRGLGRLKPGVALEQVRAELQTIASQLEAEYPTTNTGKGATAYPLNDEIVGETRSALLILLGAVGLVLLIACANIANLLLANGATRHKELGIRAALGAGGGRLVRQLLTESLVLALAGGACGAVLALWTTRALSTLSAETLPRADGIDLDATVLGFTLLIASATGLLFGLAPALQAARADLNLAIGEGGRGTSRGAARRQIRNALIVGEVALSLVLLIGAGLLLKSLDKLQNTNPGFTVETVLSAQLSLPSAEYPEARTVAFYEQLSEAIDSLPGVSAVGATNILPLSRNYDGRGFQIDERPMPPGENPSAQARSVHPGFFDAMGIRLLRGRLFDIRDVADAPLVVVINEASAREFWPEGDAIGKRLTYNAGVPREEQQVAGGLGSREIIGIVSDTKHLALAAAAEPFFYTPHAQIPHMRDMTLVVQSDSTDPASLAGLIRREVATLDPDVPLFRVLTLASLISSATAEPRFQTLLLGTFAAIALLLALVGVYGVIAYTVSQRTHEIGLRMALGAGSGEVTRMLLSEGMTPVLIGIGVGLVGAFGLTRVLTSMLYDVSVTDPATYVAVPGALIATALLASYIPARRAMRIDPGSALRGE